MLVRWDPFKEIERIHDEINKVFDTSMSGRNKEEAAMVNWYPAVDVYEDQERVVISAELPGIDPKNVELNIEGDVLTLKGERKFEHEENKENYLRVERAYGTFMRSFTLPDYVDKDNISAEYEKGILKITLPKKPETKPKKVQISVKGK